MATDVLIYIIIIQLCSFVLPSTSYIVTSELNNIQDIHMGFLSLTLKRCYCTTRVVLDELKLAQRTYFKNQTQQLTDEKKSFN